MGTINYKSGPPVRDYLQMWIEHHIFPNVPPNKYPACGAKVREICRKHGVPYRSEPLRRRMWPMVDMVVGKKTMPHVTGYNATVSILGPHDDESDASENDHVKVYGVNDVINDRRLAAAIEAGVQTQ